MGDPFADFHCDECDRDFTRLFPRPGLVPFIVEGQSGIHLDGMRGRIVSGVLLIEAATCAQCCRLALRTELRDLAAEFGWTPPPPAPRPSPSVSVLVGEHGPEIPC